MRNYLRLLKFLEDHKGLFALAVVTMMFASFFEVFQISMIVPLVDIVFTNKPINPPQELPQFLQSVVKFLNETDRQKVFPIIFAAFLIMLFLRNILVFAYQFMMGKVSQSIMRDIRYKLYAKIQNLSLDYFGKKRTGELISRITHDVGLIENSVSYGVTDLFRQSFTILFWVSIAFTIDFQAAFIIFFVFPIIGYPMNQIGKKIRKIAQGTQEKVADINSHLLETISGIQLVKAFCNEEKEVERFKRDNFAFYKLKLKQIKRLIVISPLTEVIGGLCGAALVLWFGNRLMNNELSLGIFILFMAAVMSIISPIKKLGNVLAMTQQALSANDRIYDVLNTEPSVVEKSDARELPEMQESIRFENVHFHYGLDTEVILKNIDLEIKKGELVAVVGPTGTGKTTLVNLIPRFYDPVEGRVAIDGIDLKDVTFRSLRAQIGIVTQETILFNDSVRSNIAYGYPNASQEDVEAAAKKAFAHQFVVKMPEGYDTKIGDRGFRLSGGEKQRIAIARAILRNPPILLLDEATSQLDSESEKIVQEALDKVMHGRTVVAIAHRLSTVRKADKIVVLEKGKIVGLDKHERLLETCPLYAKLHSMQFQMK